VIDRLGAALCSVPRLACQKALDSDWRRTDLAVEAGRDLDVVNGEDVCRVGGGEQQRALNLTLTEPETPGSGRASHRKEGGTAAAT